jgi:hypothetical protein
VPTGFSDEKYWIHPIYSICLFLDVRSKTISEANNHAQPPLKHILFGYVSADFILQNLGDLFSENLAQVLSNEKKEMPGEQGDPAKKRGVHRSCFSSFAGSVSMVRKARWKKWWNLKS